MKNILFTFLIEFVTEWCVEPFTRMSSTDRGWLVVLCAVPALGLLAVCWFCWSSS